MLPNKLDWRRRRRLTVSTSELPGDVQSEEYTIRLLRELINAVGQGALVVFERMTPALQTALYDLFNCQYANIGGKLYCRVAVGANTSPNFEVHPEYNSIVYVREEDLPGLDTPFLNRFEKHFITINSFMSDHEMTTLTRLQFWLQSLTSRFLEKGTMTLSNLIINATEESLSSLVMLLGRQGLSEDDLLL